MDGSRRLFWSAIQSTHERMKAEGNKLAGLVVATIGIVFENGDFFVTFHG